MRQLVIITIGFLVLVVIGTSVFLISEKEPMQIACTEEAKICPDGSAVGRTGPNCEFEACPPVEQDETIAMLNQEILLQGVFLTPLEVMEDSRCPIDVTCIQAGRVRLRMKVGSDGDVEETTLTLGSPFRFAGKKILLMSVSPVPSSKQVIATDDYRFEFSVVPDIQ